jgi:gliding motility-associated-like protein
MKNSLFRLLILSLVAVLFSYERTEASHALGAEITYECLGGNEYLVRLVFYRDCEGIAAPTAPTININSSCGNQNLGMTLLPPEDPFPPFDQYLVDYELPVYCEPSNCGSGNRPGIQQYVYEATVTLPPCADWTMSYDLCCRSAAINTISAPGSQDIYVSAFLNNQDAPCNNSPQFDVPARGFLCLNEDNTILATAYDPDGDLIVYSLYTPWDNPGQSVNYTGGFNQNNPLSSNYYNFNEGVIETQPTANGQITVIGVMVEEYRNGVLIGRVVRDMQVRVINNCPQNPGNDFDIDQDGFFDEDTIVLCADNPVQLDVYLNNTLPNLNYNIVADNLEDFPGATFENVPDGSAPGGIVGQFNWTPDETDIGTEQTLIFTAFDDNCPVVGFANFTYEFIITGLELEVDIDTVAISCTDSVQMNTVVSNGFPPYTYLWNNGSTDPSIWVTAGQYIVEVTDSEGCVGDDTIDVFYIDDPVAVFQPSNACEDSAITFVDESFSNYPAGFPPLSIVDWQWDFGDGNTETGVQNPTHTYTDNGSYTVQLIATNDLGCVDTTESVVWANPAPEVDFDFSNVCTDTLFTFTDQSTIDTGQIVAWGWDFGDGSAPVQQQNTTHQYANTGYYDVTLVAVSDSGCPSAITQEIYSFPLPVADFSPTDVCIGNVSSFNDLTAVSAGTVEGWQWDFGDGTGTSTSQDPIYTYQDTGVFDVTLIATTDSVCRDTITQEVTVHPSPTAGFFTDTVCAQLELSFTDTSTVPTGNIVAWSWFFGDGGTSSDQNPTNIYNLGGQYTASLAVESDLGCIDTMAQNVIVYPKPNADFLTFAACLNDTNQFTDQSTVATGSQIEEWNWDFDDNVGSSTDQNPWYIFDDNGIYDVELITETNNGCLDTVVKPTQVFVLPEPDFSFNDVCAYNAAVFQNNSTIEEGSITNHNWDFGNGNTISVEQPVGQEYDTAGTYTVQLINISNQGCTDTIEQDIEIFPVPRANFTYDTVCFPSVTTFTDLSSVGGGNAITEWNWKFGDGIVINGVQDPTYAYTEWGEYNVQLTVTTENGCIGDTTLSPVIVRPKPSAEFSDELANCLNDTTEFEDLSSVENYPFDQLVSWSWDFDDGDFSDAQDTLHVFSDDGFYNVSLAVETNNGCQDTVIYPVEIYPLPEVAFTVDTNMGCQPFRVQFTDQTSIPQPYLLSSWDWNFGDGSSNVSAPNPSHTYWDEEFGDFETGLYSVSLEVTSANGCVSDTTYVDYITEYPKPDALFAVDPERTDIIFPKFTVSDLSSPNVVGWNYTWGDGATSAEQNPVHEYQDTGYYDITQLVTTEFGCLDTAQVTVRVDPEFRFYIPSAFTPDADDVNETFYGSGIGIVEYRMRIYDRWGELIFESNDADFHWDGTYMGKQVQKGVYIYQFDLLDVKGEPHRFRGHVTLFR